MRLEAAESRASGRQPHPVTTWGEVGLAALTRGRLHPEAEGKEYGMASKDGTRQATPAEPTGLSPDGTRPDPLLLLAQQEAKRLPWLLPVRHRRMAETPFTFFRGAAVVMASDLARQPHSGLMVQLCGDAHLLNFGFYASPERQLLFDLNDFDETHPGPFEWDVQRLATSFLLAGRSLGLNEKQQSRICRRCVRTYGEAMADFARMPVQKMWVLQLRLEQLINEQCSAGFKAHLNTVAATALQRDSHQAVRKLCEITADGTLRFRHEPPLIWRFEELSQEWRAGLAWQEWAGSVAATYQDTLAPGPRRLFSQFRVCDTALKAVGVGSVGTRCAVTVLVGDHPDDVLVLQAKQAEPSVLAPYVAAEAPTHEGQRVVQGQQVMQTASDPFLGWGTNPRGDHLYVRHFRDWKASVDIAQLDREGLKDYGRLCGWTLAKAHARSGNRHALTAHIGNPKAFAQVVLEQALAHAEQTERDHAALVQGIAAGKVSSSALL